MEAEKQYNDISLEDIFPLIESMREKIIPKPDNVYTYNIIFSCLCLLRIRLLLMV